MRKRILSLVLVCVMICTMLPCIPKSVEASSIRWEVINANGITGADIYAHAKKYIGSLRYDGGDFNSRTGFTSPPSFDCSGLVYRVCRDAGLASSQKNENEGTNAAGNYYITSNTFEQKNYGERLIDAVNLYKTSNGQNCSGFELGDLIFFDYNGDSKTDHVGIYSGSGCVINSTSSRGVVETPLSQNGWEGGTLGSWLYDATRLVGSSVSDRIPLGIESLTCKSFISNQTHQRYIDRMMHYYLNNNSALVDALNNGKSVVMMFEGGSDNYPNNLYSSSGSNIRNQAVVIVLQKKNGKVQIVFQNEDCSSIPGQPEDTNGSAGHRQTILMDGFYKIETCNHKGLYGALHVMANTGYYTPPSNKDGLINTVYGINIHTRSSATSGYGDSAWSHGCQLIGADNTSNNAFNEFIKTVVGVNYNVWLSYTEKRFEHIAAWDEVGYYLVDRQLAKDGLTTMYTPYALEQITAFSTEAYEYAKCDHEEYTDLGVCKNPDCKEVYDWQSTYETSSAGLYKVTKLTGIWLRTDVPYEASTNKSQNKIGWGKEVEVLGSVINAVGTGQNVWYKVSYKGEIGYTYAGNLERVSYFPQNIYVAENSFAPAAGATIPKASQNLEGKVISTYPLTQVVAYLDGEAFATWNAPDNDTYELDLKQSVIDYALAFGELPSGKHMIELKGMDIHRKELTTFHTSYFITEGAQPEPIYYTVILNPYGGNCETTSISVKEQTAIGSLPTPTRTGYYFDGWYSAAVGGSRISEDTVFTSGRTIYARWLPIYYTVSYDSQTNSDISYDKVSVQHGYTLEKMPTPSQSGYSFQGWYTDPTGGMKVTEQTEITSAMTLYAHWTANLVTVSFNANGGSVSISKKTVTYKQTYGELPIPARSGYTFTGWMYDGGVDYSRRINSDSIVESYYGHTLIAQWKETVYKVNGGNIYFDNTTGTITGADSSIISADIPETIDGVTVRAIGDGAFWDCSKMTNISLPNTLKTIGKEAFRRCSQLTAIDFPASLTTIGEGAFRECANLIKITIPASVTQIGDQAFYDCRFLNSVSVNENNNTYSSVDGVLMNKGKTRIIYCPTRLIVVDNRYEIPAGVKEIAAYAFYEVTSIANITVPQSVTTIDTTSFGSSAIEVEEENQYYSSIDGALFNKEQTTLLHYPKMRQGSYAVPAGVVKIAEDAFYGSMLSSVTLSESVQVIEKSAFSHARLRNISLPESLKRIDDSAFFSCQNLQEVTIPENVETVGDYAFDWCSYLSVVYFQGDVPTLGEFAFGNSNTKKKETVLLFKDWKNGWTGTSYDGYQISPYESRFKTDGGYIYYNVFDGMIINCDSAVSNIVIPATINGTEIAGIAANAFSKCTQATQITIPEGLTDISIRAFSGSSIKTVIYQGTVVQWLEGHSEINYVFDTVSIQCSDKLIPANLAYIGLCSDGIMWHISKDRILTIDGTGAIEDFASNTAPWNNLRSFVKEIVISQGITRIGSYSFQNLKAEKVSIPGSCTSIGDYAFKDCSLLQTVVIPDGVKAIGKEAFCGCKALSEITIPTSVDTLGYRVFNGSAEDTSVYYAGTTEQWNAMVENRMPSYFDKGVQLYCDGSKLPENTIYMGTAGENVEWYLSVDGTLTITGIGPMISDYEIKVDIDNAGFDDWYYDTGCPWKDYDSLIVKVIIEEGITSVSRNAFLQHEMLESVLIPSTVTEIEEAAFNGCVKLQRVTIENGVNSIGASAFAGCSSLETVTVPGSVSSLGRYVFDNCTSLTAVTFEDGCLTQLASYTFAGCESLQTVKLPDSMVDLGYGTFVGCTSLRELHIPKGVKVCTWENISTNAGIKSFYVDSSNPYLSCVEGVLFDKDITTLLLYPKEKTAEAYYMPETVTTIAEEAFLGNTYLKTVTIPADINEIGDRAFLDCINLTGIYFAGQRPYYGKNTFKKYVEGSTTNYENLPNLVIYYREEAYYEGWNSNPFSEYKKDTWEFEVIEYQVTGGSIYFETISGKIIDADTSVTAAVIPSQIDGWTVSSIGECAFQYCENLTGITLPDSITSIGENAFCACFSLKSIVIPEGVAEIPMWAFSYCRKLATITIPRSVKAVQYAAFMECESLNHILYAGTAEEWANIRIVEADDYWPDENNYAMINARTVHYEASEVELYAKESCTYSGMYCPMCNAFAYGSPLDSDIHNFQNYVCTKCDAPQVLRYTLKENGEAVIYGWRFYWSEIEIPSYIEGCRVVEIADDTFAQSSIENIVIPDTVETVGSSAFLWCHSLENVIIGSGLKTMTMPGSVFNSCEKLKGIWVDPDNQYFSSDDYGVLFNKDYSVLLKYPDAGSAIYTVPDEVITIGQSAFSDSINLEVVYMGSGVTIMEGSSFSNCTKLKEIHLNDTLSSIENYVFYQCNSLSDVYYGGTTAQWEDLRIGEENDPLLNATLHTAQPVLTGISILNQPSKTEYWVGESLDTTGLTLTVTYSDGSTETLTEGFNVSGFNSTTAGTKTVSVTFKGKIATFTVTVDVPTVTDITIKNQPTKTKYWIGESLDITGLTLTATYSDGSTKTITEGFTVSEFSSTTVGSKTVTVTYNDKTAIFDVVVLLGGTCGDNLAWSLDSEGVLTIFGTGAMSDYGYGKAPWYAYRDQIYQVVICDGVTTIGIYALYGCSNISNAKIGSTVTTIKKYAFYKCSNMTSVTIPQSVTTFEDAAFANCENLTNVYITDLAAWVNISSENYQSHPFGIVTKANKLYLNGELVTEAIIPEGVTYISEYAFRCCYDITDVRIPNGVTSIGAYAFEECDSLTNITIPTGVTVINLRAFYDCEALVSVSLPTSLTTVKNSAFKWCTVLTHVYYAGTAAKWEAIEISANNTELLNATLHTQEEPTDPIALKSMNMQLGSSMSLNLNGLASVLDQYENVYVIYEAEGKDPVKVTRYFESINQNDNTLRYNFAYEGLTILDLNLKVNYTIYGTFNGKEYHSETKSITLLTYCRSSVTSGNGAAVPCANLLKYAMAAEAYMAEVNGMDTVGHLVNVLTETELAAVETYAYADSAFNAQKTSVVSQGTRVKFKAQALDMVSRITLLYKIEITDSTVDTSKLTFKVEYTDTEGTAQVKNYTFSDLTYDEATGYYVLSFSEFYATQMREGAKCTIYLDGVEHASYTNSIENYCYTAVNKDGESELVKQLARRISLYGDACYEAYGNQ